MDLKLFTVADDSAVTSLLAEAVRARARLHGNWLRRKQVLHLRDCSYRNKAKVAAAVLAKMPRSKGLAQRPVSEQIEELKAKINLIGE